MKRQSSFLSAKKSTGIFSIIIPGILMAATGIGAGDLATASFTGSQLGVAVLWAVAAGGIFKFVLTEGLARWQLVTGTSFLEGVAHHFGKIWGWLFMPYLLLWSFFVGSALISACGVTMHALFPVFDDPVKGKIIFGIICSVAGLVMVWLGGFRLFERVMSVCIALMFISVLVTAIILWPGTPKVLSGLFIPTIPDLDNSGLTWTVALIGGVGGTLTILSYGYWIKEKGRTVPTDIKTSKIDLASGYLVTVIFGIAMVIIGSTIEINGKGAGLLVILAQRLNTSIGSWGSLLFLVGAFGAVFSSLLGVWQSIPYLFADLWRLFFGKPYKTSLEESRPYKYYLLSMAIIPVCGLFIGFREVQKLYAVTGALFIPLLAFALLIMNGNKKWLHNFSNGVLSKFVLTAALIYFGWTAWLKWIG